MNTRRICRALAMGMMGLGLALPGQAQAQDVYFGTLEAHGNELWLRRCSSGGPQYRLLPPPGQSAQAFVRIAHLRQQHRNIPIQAAIFGEYQPYGADGHALQVFDARDVRLNSSCHLLDWLSELMPPPKAASGLPQ